MSFLGDVCVLILTHNEEDNLARTLAALGRFPSIVVLDSESDDSTADIVARHANARLVKRPFETHASQWNSGLTSCGITQPWILALDADYVLRDDLVEEIAALAPAADVCGYRARFRYCIFGRPLAATLYPPVTVLYRRDRARYIQQGHTQRVVIEGRVHGLRGHILHDDRKPLSRWLVAQRRYAALEAEYLLGIGGVGTGLTARIRLMMGPAPLLVFLYTLVAKRCLFEGWKGWFYVLQRTLVETMIALELIERRRAQSQPGPSPDRSRLDKNK